MNSKKKFIEKKVLKVIGKVVDMEVQKTANIWPPLCGGLVHQPKRPIKKK